MNKIKTTMLTCALLLASNTSIANAATVSFSDFYMVGGSSSFSAAFDAGFLSELDGADLGALPKFDPSLGTLTGVSLSLDGEVIYDVFIEGLGVIDDSADHFADATFIVTPGIATPSGSSLILAATDFIFDTISCFGGAFDDPCSEFGGGFGFTAVMDPLSDLTPFEGPGFLDDLALLILGGIDGSFLDNLDDAFVEIGAGFEGTVTVTYEYTPVPLPAAIWFMGSALLGLGLTRRTAR